MKMNPYKIFTGTLLATFFCLMSGGLFAQTFFQKVYTTSPYDEEGLDVMPMADGGYLIAGYTTNTLINDIDLQMTKTDAAGNMVWRNTYGGARPDFPYRMLLNSDGTYFVIGYSQSYSAGDYDVFLIKLDGGGAFLWQKTYGGWGNDQGYEIIATNDGNYMIVGNSNSAAMADQDVYLVKIDPAGNKIWDKYLGGPANDFGNSIKQTPDGGFIVMGMTFGAGANGDAYMLKTDAGGNFSWSKNFGGGLYDEGVFITVNGDGTMVFAIRDSSNVGNDIDVRVIKTDAGGNVLWNKSYGGSKKDTPKMVQATMDGGYVVAAITRSFNLVNPDMWIVKLDANGDTTWTRKYGGFQNEHCYVVREMWDGSLIATGKTSSFSPNFDAIFVKMNSMGTLTLGVEAPLVRSDFRLFPNPTAGSLHLDLSGTKPLALSVTDMSGKEVYVKKKIETEELTIDLEGKSPGLYFVTVRSASTSITKKIVLQ